MWCCGGCGGGVLGLGGFFLGFVGGGGCGSHQIISATVSEKRYYCAWLNSLDQERSCLHDFLLICSHPYLVKTLLLRLLTTSKKGQLTGCTRHGLESGMLPNADEGGWQRSFSKRNYSLGPIRDEKKRKVRLHDSPFQRKQGKTRFRNLDDTR